MEKEKQSFDELWFKSRSHILSYCGKITDNPDERDEVFQEVAIRAWKGYKTFRGNSVTFVPWVKTIARREWNRRLKKIITERERLPQKVFLDETSKKKALENEVTENIEVEDKTFIHQAIIEAEQENYLSKEETIVLKTRLKYPKMKWKEIDNLVAPSKAKNWSAVTHTKAIPKLRTYIFVYRPEYLGGIDYIHDVYKKALSQKVISEGEQEVFEIIVLRRESGYRRSGWRNKLRSACTKLAKFIEWC